MPKYERYQDYAIRDGRLIGEFEQMYRDFADPWHQTAHDQFASEKAVGINLLSRLKATHGIGKVVDLGCGLGHYSSRMAAIGLDVVGIDVSATAIEKARSLYGRSVEFVGGRFEDFPAIATNRPDVIVMAEITWYVLDHLRSFIDFCKLRLPNTFLLHLLTTYPPRSQQYGTKWFTSLPEIENYFGMRYLESGEIHYAGGAKTWFLGTWNAGAEAAWNTTIGAANLSKP
jgi:SAM-dependent methyltransferase